MKESEIIEGNILVAEFLGLPPHKVSYTNFTKDPVIRKIIKGFKVKSTDIMVTTELDLKYHSSWDWLMPVVEKIEKIHSEVLISDCSCGIVYDGEIKPKHAKSKTEATWLAVIEFIKWYNTNK